MRSPIKWLQNLDNFLENGAPRRHNISVAGLCMPCPHAEEVNRRLLVLVSYLFMEYHTIAPRKVD